jgi:lysophospholipase L1-like esterase
MKTYLQYMKLGVVVMAWSLVLLAITYRSHTPVVFGRYSWGYAAVLSLLIVIAAVLSLAEEVRYLKLYQARAGILLSGVSCVLSLGVLEVGIRLVDPLGISYYELAGAYMRDKLADEQLVFRHKSSWENRYGEVLVTYNEQGLRDRPILPKVAREYRILALGDSVTFGWGVPQDQVFTSKLEQLLPGLLQRPVRVINSGVGGYNTVQEVIYFKREGMALQPDLVMLTYVQNDIEVNRGPFDPWGQSSLWGKSFPDMMITMAGKLWSYRLAHHTYKYAWPKFLKADESTTAQESVGWHQSMAALEELVAKCKEVNIPLMVFFRRSHPDENRPLFEDVVRHAHAVPVVDMGYWYVGLDESVLVNSKVDGHPNAEGHRVMAEHMAKDITDYLAQLKYRASLSGQAFVSCCLSMN